MGALQQMLLGTTSHRCHVWVDFGHQIIFVSKVWLCATPLIYLIIRIEFQAVYSPKCSLYISYGCDKENLYFNQGFYCQESSPLLRKMFFHLVTSVGQEKQFCQKQYTIDIVDPSSMRDVCHVNFVIDPAHRRVFVAQWQSIGAQIRRFEV